MNGILINAHGTASSLPPVSHAYSLYGDNFMDTLNSIGKISGFKKGDSVFLIGQSATHLFQLITGEVHLYRHSYDGKQILLFRAYDGGFFAEASLNNNKYHCTAICKKDSVIQSFDAKKVCVLLQQNRAFSMAWIDYLSSNLRWQRACVERLNLKSVVDRIIHYLVTEGSPTGEITLQGTLTELAEVLGISREALYRSLALMEKKGVIERTGNKLRIIKI